jgi:hypothetical protein
VYQLDTSALDVDKITIGETQVRPHLLRSEKGNMIRSLPLAVPYG